MRARHRNAVVVVAIVLLAAVLASAAGAFGPTGGTENGSLTLPANGDGQAQTSALPSKVKQATVTVSPDTSSDDTVFDKLYTILSNKPTFGARAVSCVLGYASLVNGTSGTPASFTSNEPTLQLLFLHVCIQLALLMSIQQSGQTMHGLVQAADGRCPLTKQAVHVTITRSGSGYSATASGTSYTPKSVGFRVSCARTAHSVRFSLRPNSRKASLKSAVGPMLGIGFLSGSSSPGTVRFSFTVK